MEGILPNKRTHHPEQFTRASNENPSSRSPISVRIECDRLITEETLELVDALARQLAQKLPPSIDTDDLRSAGLEGLLTAARHFEPARNVPFAAYARMRIRGAMLDQVRRSYRESTAEPLTHQQSDPVDLDAEVQRRQRADMIRAELERLPVRERSLIAGHDLNGETLTAVGRRLGISLCRASSIRRRGIERLREKLVREGRLTKSDPDLPITSRERLMAKSAIPISRRAAELQRRVQVVDELGQLERELAAMKPQEARAKSLKAEIQAWADAEFPADQAVTFEGHQFAAQVGAKGNKRRISSMQKVFDFLGVKKFLAACSFTLKSAEETLAPDQLKAVIVEDANVGDRSVKVLQRATAAAALKAVA